MQYKIRSEDKPKLERALRIKGLKPKWAGDYLIVSSSLEDTVTDIFFDEDIEYIVKVYE